jgi:hypothetical protein
MYFMYDFMYAISVFVKVFEPLVIFSSDDSDLRLTFAAITHLALHNSDPLVSSQVSSCNIPLYAASRGQRRLESRDGPEPSAGGSAA